VVFEQSTQGINAVDTSFSTGQVNFNYPPVYTVQPRVDILDLDTHFVYLLDIAGADPEKLDLEISPAEVVINAPLEAAPKYEKANILYQERPKGTYSRLLTLPPHIDLDNVSADFRNGVLEVCLPKKSHTSAS